MSSPSSHRLLSCHIYLLLYSCRPAPFLVPPSKCVRHGHDLVCLANLYPPAAASDEADSFMYQSAAHTAIEAQAECFGKPLIRRLADVIGCWFGWIVSHVGQIDHHLDHLDIILPL